MVQTRTIGVRFGWFGSKIEGGSWFTWLNHLAGKPPCFPESTPLTGTKTPPPRTPRPRLIAAPGASGRPRPPQRCAWRRRSLRRRRKSARRTNAAAGWVRFFFFPRRMRAFFWVFFLLGGGLKGECAKWLGFLNLDGRRESKRHMFYHFGLDIPFGYPRTGP